ncbi:MAG: ribosome biogenesis GTPase Der [Arenicellales bacterium]
MIPVVALVGRPNVGKSTLFNRLTRSRQALVDDQPGVTRDRLYGEVWRGSQKVLVVDTGGLSDEAGELSNAVRQQVDQALEEADAVVFIVDARDGLTHQDIAIGANLRKGDSPVFVAVNKAEGLDGPTIGAEYFELALGDPLVLSARTGQGVEELLGQVLARFPLSEAGTAVDNGRRVAVVGRPNVGKSTLVNALVGEPRLIVADSPGTTRDSIQVPMDRYGQRMVLVDTAGVRRKSRVHETLEKFSVVKTLQALASADAALLVLDARAGLSDQDAAIAGIIVDSGRSIVVAVNKWDGLERRDRNLIRRDLTRRLDFLPEHESLFISALHGSGIGDLIGALQRAQGSALAELGTGALNRALAGALEHHSPPLINNRTVKPKYAHQGGRNPPIVVLHGNLLHKLPASYLRYLGRSLAKTFHLIGTQVRFELRKAGNPYSGRPSYHRRKHQ